MKLSINVLNEIWPEAVFVGDFDSGYDIFDHCNIAHLKQFETLRPENSLYFVVYEDNLELFEELAEAIFSNWNAENFDESLLVPVGVTKPEFYRY